MEMTHSYQPLPMPRHATLERRNAPEVMTFEQAAAIRTLSDSERDALWNRYYETTTMGGFANDRVALLALIKTAPCFVEMPNKYLGLFPTREDVFLWIAMHKDSDECCMARAPSREFESMRAL